MISSGFRARRTARLRPILGSAFFEGEVPSWEQETGVIMKPKKVADRRVATPLPRKGLGFYSYVVPARRYGRKRMVAALVAIARAWAQAHPRGPRIGFGDLSFRFGGPMPPHQSHQRGLDLDVRLVRTDRKEAGTSYQQPVYSRALTQQLVNLFRANRVLPPKFILFNDPNVKGVRPWKGHDNHLHVRFVDPPAVAAGLPATAPRPVNTVQIGAGTRTAPVTTTVSGFLKDVPRLQAVALPPATPATAKPPVTSMRRALAATYNRLGGLMNGLARQTNTTVPGVLAVWMIESAGRTHTPGKAIIRFENHLLYRLWGKDNEALYQRHFRHGGHAGQPGKSWHNHAFREDPNAAFEPVHPAVKSVGWAAAQAQEYRVLRLAIRLAGEERALRCISIGGPQILIENFKILGYRSAREMFDAFQASERAHVLGFFDYCQQRRTPKRGDMIRYLQAQDWRWFAHYYNGAGQVDAYATKLRDAFAAASAVLP